MTKKASCGPWFPRGTDCEVLFELQNRLKLDQEVFRRRSFMSVFAAWPIARACVARPPKTRWLPLDKAAPSRAAHENDWSLSGRVIAFKPLKNPLSGTDLYWIHLDLER